MPSSARRSDSFAPDSPPSALREATAVLLLCGGALTLLALLSYHAEDLSLNATGQDLVRNWIGPAGAYWADLLLQSLGLGAYALGLGIVLSGWRAFFGFTIWPGGREVCGIALLVVAIGSLSHLLFWEELRPYPAGGLPGVLLGPLLRERFARLGSYIVACSMCLIALALTADGILYGLGWRGIGILQWLLEALRGAAHRSLLGGRRLRVLLAAQRVRRAGARTAPSGVPQRLRRLRRTPGEGATEPTAPASSSQGAAATSSNGEPGPRGDDALRAVAKITPPRQQLALGNRADSKGPPGAAAGTAEDDEESPENAPLQGAAADGAGAAGPQIVNVRPDLHPQFTEAPAATALPERVRTKAFELPPVSLLDYEAAVREPVDPEKLRDNALRLTKTLKDYGIDGHVREIRPGPVVTMYEYVPGPGIKLSKIASLADDLAMSMEALRVRIVAPIPGKGAVGIEIPNETRETVYLKEIIAHDAFRNSKNQLTMALGKDIEGAAYVANLARMPHLLVAGATGAGKSVSVNAMIMSVLFKSTPAEVRMIMVDPKMLELSVYEGIPHLLLPVVTDPKKAALALRWAVEEMERRYEVLSEMGVRSIDGYNARVRAAAAKGETLTQPNKHADGAEPQVCEPMPYLLVIVDELADLMMVASREVETSIMRLAQMARAAGIHLILATQRPSVDVLTGVIKANFPTRIAFQVASRHDSRTIIDGNGAEHLLGSGDMLYLSPGAGGLMRVHGAYVSDEEIERAVTFLKAQGRPQYDESILAPRDEGDEAPPIQDMHDDMYDQAVAIVAETRQASISMIQRRLRIGYNRSARMVERMEMEGIVGPSDGAKPRDVLVAQQ
jgi:DNA segregation ATPase FtsK/SpoIIIE-like protein